MIIATTPIIVNLKTEAAVPTGPVSDYSGVDAGEIVLTTDTGRVIIGPNTEIGNQNVGRSYFPYENNEILTEKSPKTEEVFSLNVRNQSGGFYLPTVIPANGDWVPVTVRDYDGGIFHSFEFLGNSISAAVDYHAFTANSFVRNGRLMVQASADESDVVDYSTAADDTTITFDILNDLPNGFVLLANNSGPDDIVLRLRKTVIDLPAPPSTIHWNTSAGPINIPGSIPYSLALSVTDSASLPIVYTLVSGSIPAGLSFANGVISGTPDNHTHTYTFKIKAADGVMAANRTFVMNVGFTNHPPVWVTTTLPDVIPTIPYAVQLLATDQDIDQQTLTYSIILGSGSLPTGLSMDSNGLITGATSLDSGGTYSFTARVTDGVAVVDQPLTLAVNAVPVWVTASGPAYVGDEQTAFTATVFAFDPEEQPITYAYVSGDLPPGASLDANAGTITGTLPAVDSDTEYAFTLSASDGVSTVDRSFYILVEDADYDLDSIGWSDASASGPTANGAINANTNTQTVTGINRDVTLNITTERVLAPEEQMAIIINDVQISAIGTGQQSQDFTVSNGCTVMFSFMSNVTTSIMSTISNVNTSQVLNTFEASITKTD